LLSVFRATATPFDTEPLAQLICEQVTSELVNFGISKDYLIGAMKAHRVSPFLTENSGILAVSFQLAFEALDISDEEGDWTDYVIAEGNCRYELDTDVVSDLRLGTIEYHKSSGEIVGANSRTTIFGTAAFTLGRKRKSYRFQEPLT